MSVCLCCGWSRGPGLPRGRHRGGSHSCGSVSGASEQGPWEPMFLCDHLLCFPSLVLWVFHFVPPELSVLNLP